MKYLDFNGITSDLLTNGLSVTSQLSLVNMTTRDRNKLNNQVFGIYIRNQYGLWMPENPHTNLDDSENPNFPDNLSATVIEKIHLHLTTVGIFKNRK